MRLNKQDLHGKNVEEALDAVKASIVFMVQHNDPGIVFVHGKGLHSANRAVLKQEVRRFLENNVSLAKAGYIVIRGEDSYPIADDYNEACVIVVKHGYENESSSEGEKQNKKTHIEKREEEREERLLRKISSQNSRKWKDKRKHESFFKDVNEITIDKTETEPEDECLVEIDKTISTGFYDYTVDEVAKSDIVFLDDIEELRDNGVCGLFIVDKIVPELGVVVYPNGNNRLSVFEKNQLDSLKNGSTFVYPNIQQAVFISNDMLPMGGSCVGINGLLLVSHRNKSDKYSVQIVSQGTFVNICELDCLKRKDIALLAGVKSVRDEVIAYAINEKGIYVEDVLPKWFSASGRFRKMTLVPHDAIPPFFSIPLTAFLESPYEYEYKPGTRIIIYRYDMNNPVRVRCIDELVK